MPRWSEPPHPWGLTEAEARALTAVCECGTNKLAARFLNLSYRTVENQVQTACAKLPGEHRIHKLIAWDRYQRGLR